jgi:hypothetical protein
MSAALWNNSAHGDDGPRQATGWAKSPRRVVEAMRAGDNLARTKNRRATPCVQRKCSWPLAALARSRSALSWLPRRSIITRARRTTATTTRHRTTATVTDGPGMTARAVGRCRAGTACPSKVQLAEDGAPITAAHPVTQFKAVLVGLTGVPLRLGRATSRSALDRSTKAAAGGDNRRTGIQRR